MEQTIQNEIKWLEEEIEAEVKTLVYNLRLGGSNSDATENARTIESSARVVSEKRAKIEILRKILERGLR